MKTNTNERCNASQRVSRVTNLCKLVFFLVWLHFVTFRLPPFTHPPTHPPLFLKLLSLSTEVQFRKAEAPEKNNNPITAREGELFKAVMFDLEKMPTNPL